MSEEEKFRKEMENHWAVVKENSKGMEDCIEQIERIFPDVLIRTAFLMSASELMGEMERLGIIAALEYLDKRILDLQKTIDTYETALKEVKV